MTKYEMLLRSDWRPILRVAVDVDFADLEEPAERREHRQALRE